jgi:4a-hydroxytetrahydrobiopterin dehydratase
VIRISTTIAGKVVATPGKGNGGTRRRAWAEVAGSRWRWHVSVGEPNPGEIMKLFDDAEIRAGLDGLKGWAREGDSIRKTYTLDTFPDAIAFVNRIAELAEEADHHPDMDIRFNRVACTLSTHSAGGLTRRDFDLARKIDEAR